MMVRARSSETDRSTSVGAPSSTAVKATRSKFPAALFGQLAFALPATGHHVFARMAFLRQMRMLGVQGLP